jgi:hypothetical protein
MRPQLIHRPDRGFTTAIIVLVLYAVGTIGLRQLLLGEPGSGAAESSWRDLGTGGVRFAIDAPNN